MVQWVVHVIVVHTNNVELLPPMLSCQHVWSHTHVHTNSSCLRFAKHLTMKQTVTGGLNLGLHVHVCKFN